MALFSSFTTKTTLFCVPVANVATSFRSSSFVSISLTKTSRTTLRACLPEDKPIINRPLADFPLDIWKNQFASLSLSDTKFKTYCTEAEILKDTVKGMLMTRTDDPVEKVGLINLLCRLGVSYHFENLIEQKLKEMFDMLHTELLDKNDHDLYTVALIFRVFRQYGYKICCDVFNKFMGKDGKFKKSLTNDTKGLLSLYEAAHLGIPGESILDEALAFTKSHLQSLATDQSSNTDHHVTNQVINALQQPLHIGMPRLEARKFIDLYASDEHRNENLLNFSKLDYNIVQFQHRLELRCLSTWWMVTQIPEKLTYARDRVVENYFWMVAMHFEPHYARARMMHCKILTLLSVVDDTYDAYGTSEEHRLFTDAIERWDYSALDSLPDYMKILYKQFLDAFCEFEVDVTQEGRWYSISYAKEAVKDMVRAYQAESEWYEEGRIPSLEEYLDSGLITAGIIVMASLSYMGMGVIAGVKEFEWLFSNPKVCRASNVVSRLMDDIATHEFEQKRPHIPSIVQCYMKEYGVSATEAVKALEKMVEDAWKDINEECMKPTDVSMDIIIRVVNIARLVDVTYRGVDRYTNPEYLREYINKLFLHPIPI